MTLSRRALLAAAAALPRLARAAEPDTLRAAARHAGLRFGSSSEVAFTDAPDYGALITTQSDLYAPNLNWKLLAPTSQDTLARPDPNIAAGLPLTGYHLLWHEGVPNWFEPLDRPQAERAIAGHIAALGTALARNSVSWNVVNEAIKPEQGRADGLRASAFLDKFGTSYFDLAFNLAREAAPQLLRVYNDYDLELATPQQEARRTSLLRLIDGLLARGVPVQAIGLQCHLRTSTFSRFDPDRFRRFLAELAARGLPILITELDVLDLSPGDPAARDREVAAIYRRFLSAALDEPAVKSVVTWGLSDRYTWLNQKERTTFRRPDGEPSRPLLFDADLRPKPAFDAVLQTLRNAPRRSMA
jgi:endo-1,4-beta-xylanase